MTAAAPLVRALRSRYSGESAGADHRDAAGRARAARAVRRCHDVRFLPYDTPGAVARFLDVHAPTAAIIMETELWPNLLRECECRGVPVLLASARLSAKSVARYRRFGACSPAIFSAVR